MKYRFNELCAQFECENPGWHAEYDDINSTKKWHQICIWHDGDIGAYYAFENPDEFSEWIKGVVLD